MCRQNKRVEIFEFAPGSWKKIVHLSTDHVDILDVSIEGCTDERLSHFLTPLLGNMNNDLCVYGWNSVN
jgi:hypothetical protein